MPRTTSDKTVGQALGGAAVLIGAVAAYLQFTQQQQASRDLLISNQVSKGFEQLAGEKIAMRLGGIYALEGVMNTSSDYHQPVLEALCAFVRESTTRRHQVTLTALLEAMFTPEHDSSGEKADDEPPNDIQAALTVIGRRKPGSGNVDLANANIPSANLRLARLSDADLRGANLRSADLSDADLHGAGLNRAHLNNATLFDANLVGANLSSVDLGGGTYQLTILIRANLSSANLGSAYLSDAHLSDAHLNYANLSRADLSRADLIDADLRGAELRGADLTGAKNLTQAQLDEACGEDFSWSFNNRIFRLQLPKGLTLKPCPEKKPVAPPLNRKPTPYGRYGKSARHLSLPRLVRCGAHLQASIADLCACCGG